MRFGVRFDKGILQDVERPLLPKLSYLIQKYATDDDMNGMSRMTGNQSPARQQSKHQNGSSAAE